MQKISIVVGIVGLIVIGWFLVHKISIDHVATVDDELSKLESELDTLETIELSEEGAAAAKNKIAARINIINSSLSASQENELSPAQEQVLATSLERLKLVLLEHQTALTSLDIPSSSNTTSDQTIITDLTKTVTAIQTYLDIPSSPGLPYGPEEATFTIAGTFVTLLNGVHAAEATDSNGAKTVTIGGSIDARADFNADGREDRALLLTQSVGDVQPTYYLVASLQTENGWQGTAGLSLGDTINYESFTMSVTQPNTLRISYNLPAVDETPLSTLTRTFVFDSDTMSFIEVLENDEEEGVQSLTSKPWTWVQTTYSNDTELLPAKPTSFTVTFSDEGTFSATTDCNSMGGSYEEVENNLTFGEMVATMMYCEDSQEQAFSQMLNEVQTYFFTTKGELIFDLKLDSGSSIFR